MKVLEGRVALVTGGAKGIGVAYCEALSAAGATVVVADIADPAPCVARLQAADPGARAVGLRFDVSVEAEVAGAVAAACEFAGGIDILVNNAALFATLPPADVTDIDVELWDRVMAVNVRGSFLMVKHVVPVMTRRGGGKIINVTSGVAYKGLPGMVHYTASKGALMAMTRALSRELGDAGICVNSLAPGAVMSDTIMQNTAHIQRYHQNATQQRALKRAMLPEDLLGALVFLASPGSDFVTGQTIAVDGGSVNT
ncbi:MAG: SDR family oxidoreductase [Steroidobacteraceae bacterium]|jgi:NAD(P)-dependent dehydrogenase (short-subunit alcohol dehydrogenase family)|nr:SDR family oxidoreductase [Steroidobacteraceae bacterium]